MIERHFRSLLLKIRRSTLVSEQIAGFLPYFKKAPNSLLFLGAFYRKQVTSCPAILYLMMQFIQIISQAQQ